MNKKAFTILELIVAMSITVILFSLGFIGIISLRRSLELRNGYNDVTSQIRTLQNAAKNVLSDTNGDVPQIYLLRFVENDNFNLEYCFDVGNRTYSCNPIDANAKSERFSEISINTTCENIGFERRTANLITLDPTGAIDNSQNCSVVVGHNFISNSLRIELNTSNNVIDYE